MSPAEDKKVCGIIMPISSLDGCSEGHWTDVLEIISGSIDTAGFEANMVSNSDEVGVIQKRIILNLYDNPIVVCDISGKNPNVMFELGVRLAFDKPTVIVKDDKTTYPFDTALIEHINYPRDLRYSKILEFKQKLCEKITATYAKSQSDASYSTFLKNFGEFKVAKLDKKEVSGQEFILEELRALHTSVRRLEYGPPRPKRNTPPSDPNRLEFCLRNTPVAGALSAMPIISGIDGVVNCEIVPYGNHSHLRVFVKDSCDKSVIGRSIHKVLPKSARGPLDAHVTGSKEET